HASLVFVVAGLAAAAPQEGAPADAPPTPVSRTGVRLSAERSAPGAHTGRDRTVYPPGALVSVRDELENFPVDVSLGGTGVTAPPTAFTGPKGFEWPLNNLRG